MDVDVSGASVSDSEGCGSAPSSSGHLSGQNSGGGSKLKRSSSAPMINQLVPQGPVSAPTTTSTAREMVSNEIHGAQPRVRRFSASFGPVSPLSPGGTRGSGPLRVCQLRVEEGMDVVNREVAHERTVQSALQLTDSLSQSWEDLTLTEDVGRPKSHSISGGSLPTSMATSLSVSSSSVSQNVPGTVSGTMSSMRRDFADPLHLTIVPTVLPISSGCSASPTRVGRQCFSPSLQQHVRNTTFCPSPSPTKKATFATRRSLSPIALRPSPLGGAGLKRKWEVDERCEPFLTPSKRASTCNPDRCIGGLLITQPHSLESTPSPAGPGSLGSVGTPESVCSSGSPGLSAPPYSPASLTENSAQTPDPPPHLFKPVSPALATDQTSSFGSQNHGDRFGSQDHNRFSNQNHTDRFANQEHGDRFGEQESREHFIRQQNRFGRQEHHHHHHHPSGDGDRYGGDEQVKGGDASDGSSSDAMITEDVPPSDLKSYQDMDLSESLSHPPLNI